MERCREGPGHVCPLQGRDAGLEVQFLCNCLHWVVRDRAGN